MKPGTPSEKSRSNKEALSAIKDMQVGEEIAPAIQNMVVPVPVRKKMGRPVGEINSSNSETVSGFVSAELKQQIELEFVFHKSKFKAKAAFVGYLIALGLEQIKNQK